MPNQADFPNDFPVSTLKLKPKKRNPRDATAGVQSKARKKADAEIMAEVRKLKARVKAIEKKLAAR